jgi:two-component system response regulator DctR
MIEVRVLIIEDDPMVIDINRKVTQSIAGFSVVGTAKSGEAGLEAIKRCKPNLVILDIFMPQLTGLEFLKEMRKLGYDIDVIMVTASQDLVHLKQGMRYGVVDYIIKPFRLDRLKESLESYLETFRRLHGKENVSQGDVDSVVRGQKPEVEIAKGLSLHTLNIIKQSLEQDKHFLTAEEIADNLGLARVTARRYLEHMVLNQEVEMRLEYGSIGRPVKKYRKLIF